MTRQIAIASDKHVLVVEDNVINQKVLSKQLKRAGFTVHIANHGLEALDFVKTTRYWSDNHDTGVDVTVILMDWEMPVCDGLTCTRKLRELEQQGQLTKHLTIIATTANARSEQVETAFAAGVVCFLQSFMRQIYSCVILG